ncbi:hypothetical protein [Cerasicoccus frondis]|uniref:hypothetical protein n=1 Tax=Cerasicoccus frondis TaxID=490090 RepID=UPI002852B78C|nr:hypothetical protein [Cerasicoccus frondis]
MKRHYYQSLCLTLGSYLVLTGALDASLSVTNNRSLAYDIALDHSPLILDQS